MGGSANVVIRGYSSFSGSNQALFVVDGTPIDNETGNSRNTVTGRGGVDFGNAAMDINPARNGAASASNPSILPNQNLKAETTTENEFGLEATLFDNRLGFDFSIYNKTTDHLLTSLDISPSTGFSGIVTNAGSIENTGIEAMIRATPVIVRSIIDNYLWQIRAVRKIL